MNTLRPLLTAELSRRPHQLKRRVFEMSRDSSIGNDQFGETLTQLMFALAALHPNRFRDEIFDCVSIAWGSDILTPLVEWMNERDRDTETIDLVVFECLQIRVDTLDAK